MGIKVRWLVILSIIVGWTPLIFAKKGHSAINKCQWQNHEALKRIIRSIEKGYSYTHVAQFNEDELKTENSLSMKELGCNQIKVKWKVSSNGEIIKSSFDAYYFNFDDENYHSISFEEFQDFVRANPKDNSHHNKKRTFVLGSSQVYEDNEDYLRVRRVQQAMYGTIYNQDGDFESDAPPGQSPTDNPNITTVPNPFWTPGPSTGPSVR